jgi:tetratricopeptide (TPR) repeat protein
VGRLKNPTRTRSGWSGARTVPGRSASSGGRCLKTRGASRAELVRPGGRSVADVPLNAARKAVEESPHFGFGWARVAELEFSFGRTSSALDAVEKSLQLAPRNAAALSLKGFLLAAENRISKAVGSFDQAIAIDGALGNAWLDRGLCRIRQGEVEAGRQDLQTAALH